MDSSTILALVMAFALGAYLGMALLKPEWFA